jgi:transposase-like protein
MNNRSKRYRKEFQLDAARLVVEQGHSSPKVAQDLGISDYSVRRWVQKFLDSGQLAADKTGLTAAEELQKLRKENSRLRVEMEILKKAAAYFARETL